MPAGISALAPSTDAGSFEHEAKNPPAFTILQKDGLDSSLPLLHVNEEDEMNASRLTNLENMKNDLYSRRRISKSNDHLVLASLQAHQTNPLRKKHQSKSQDSLTAEEKPAMTKTSIVLSTEDFNEVLNAKLKKIQEQAEAEQSRRSPKKSILPQKKPFITTVKTGEFLMPPPEVAALLGIAPNGNDEEATTTTTADGCSLKSKFKSLVSLAKRPEVRHSSHNARCPAALKATVDFSLGMMNATTIAASTLDERARRFKRSESAFPQEPRALPKKLEPIEGMMNALPRLRGDQPVPFRNIMFDHRVARGTTCASVPALIDGEQSIAARQAEARRRHLARKRAQAQATKALIMRIGSPPPVPGRKHEPVQTEVFLEELAEKPDESEIATQTDYYEKPVTPRYCPPKTGQDAYTQIEPGELFDYDIEVQPILEVLVGKTIEQALIEVLEEEEIAALKEQQRRFLELRDAEKAEEQRLAEQDRRLREEKDRRLKQQEKAMKTQQETEERVAAAVLLTGYIAELLPAVLEGLKISGFLLDDIKADVEGGFMPWLMKEVKKEMGNMIESRELLMEIIREILENRAQTYRQLGEEYDASRDKRLVTEENVEEGGVDSNFVNYQSPPASGNHDAV
ncbi:PREDICTED: radial spoke head protein 3 homolog isoform X2 [Dinoponera quadriceps]|uniref:Radial spoke head protein 3 homolog isoform X2 n=1 Tax=Dinoponera quadriceps TaxID=609295 RepID=A0A6P3Y576_DINQU|nr:PREDICTED: radial spoke head protein 3 homolog isoform X2 [Dinoponera quadriceps]